MINLAMDCFCCWFSSFEEEEGLGREIEVEGLTLEWVGNDDEEVCSTLIAFGVRDKFEWDGSSSWEAGSQIKGCRWFETTWMVW